MKTSKNQQSVCVQELCSEITKQVNLAEKKALASIGNVYTHDRLCANLNTLRRNSFKAQLAGADAIKTKNFDTFSEYEPFFPLAAKYLQAYLATE